VDSPLGDGARGEGRAAREGVLADRHRARGDPVDVPHRRPTFTILCLATIAAALWLYQGHDAYGASFLLAAFAAGGISASFYGFFPLYFPELFPTAVRATGQGFAFNFGRIIAAIGGLQTATLMAFFDGSFPKAGSVLVAIYLVGVVLVWFGPETKGRPLPD
jgi:MFS family permease